MMNAKEECTTSIKREEMHSSFLYTGMIVEWKERGVLSALSINH
ncbi:Hypothetical protein Tpal_2191 [Trichococcus palustris]|uniref:Uncharacterized protein n=1 Tax=Trichococcus palustris TaxID=140314 RepID=A0A143YV42_9LACT|nr:Hypothetical protein Tpal_2191 [Trichococcus palustris]SFL14983.1 hypothetical protein SAMN04488076_1251 [Trichococcus palustris]